MKPRIEKIQVKRNGPLEKDFEMNPADLNLIYGLNETGKTYVLESLVRLLFKMKAKQAREDWSLREWDTNGKIDVSGLEENGHTSFLKSSKQRFEDYLADAEEGVPQDFSRLLVVRAGETVLSRDPDGVSRDILKKYLSDGWLLDELDKRISKTIRGAQVTGGTISGKDMGEISDHNGLEEERDELEDLLDEVKQNFSEGPVSTLRKNLEAKEKKLNRLERARCHQAFRLRSERTGLESEKADLVSSEELLDIEKKINDYENKVDDTRDLEKQLKPLQAAAGRRRWCEGALQSYDNLFNPGAVKGPGKIWIGLAAVAFLAGVIGGFVDQKWILGIGAILSALFAWLFFRKVTETGPAEALVEVELKRISQDYEKHFDEPLESRASLLSQLEDLRIADSEAKGKQKILEETAGAVRTLQVEIKGLFHQAGFEELGPGDWRKTLVEIRGSHRDFETRTGQCTTGIETLGVLPQVDLQEDPGIDWDADEHADISGEVSRLKEKIGVEENRLGVLREQTAISVGLSPATEWSQLLEALQQARDSKRLEYKECTAEILAKVGLWQVIEGLRQKETEGIESKLKKDELIAPLSALTGRHYQSIHLDAEEKLEIGDADGNSFALADLSTGVREQICLALRFGFASIALEGPAFLLLDDAFQHSDWERRPRMIEYMVELTRQGWQVFYFTMDEHIRDQFCEAGKALGDDFKYEELVK
jgi:uncharacterized protein YhaN